MKKLHVRTSGVRTVTPTDALAKLDVELLGLPGALEVVQVLTATALGEATATASWAETTADAWRAALRRHRVAPLALQAIEDGALRVPRKVHRDLVADCLSIEALRAQFDRAAHEVTRALRGRAIEHRFLKGFATARLDHRSPAIRHYGDLDVLVKESDHPAAVEALEAVDFSRGADRRRHWRVHKGWTLRAANGTEVDLHFRLSRALRATDLALLWRGQEVISGHSDAFPTLAPSGRLVHACVHLALTEPQFGRLSSLFDVTVLRHHEVEGRALAASLGWDGVVDWALALEHATRTGMTSGYELRHRFERLQHLAFMRPRRIVALDTLCTTLAAPGLGAKAQIAADKVNSRRG